MTNRTRLLPALLVALAAALPGCASIYNDAPVKSDLIAVNHQAADALLDKVRLDPTQPVLVATFVNVDALTESSRLGKLFAEQVAGRIANRGIPVTELKLREQLFIKRATGALLLSDEVRDLSRNHRAQAVVVGTYASSGKVLYLNLKLIQPEGSLVIAAHDYALPMDGNIGGLLY